MAKETIIILSHIPWDFPCDYIKQTALELSKKARVGIFYPFSLPTLRQLISERENDRGGKFSPQETIEFFLSIGFLPFPRFSIVKWANFYLNLLLFRLLYHFKFGTQQPIFYGFSYQLARALPFLSWGKYFVYDRPDQAASLDQEDDKRIKQQDQRLLRASDFVFVNSQYALQYVKRYNQKSFLGPWGCTPELFLKKRVVVPEEVKAIKRPRLGFVGHLDHRLNLRLLFDLANKRRDWNFIFVGPIYDFDPKQQALVEFDNWIEKIKGLPNVFFLGRQPKEKMPEFIAGFDVCFIPYDVSQEFVKGCNPMKLYEYLAMGKPVVSTPIEAVKRYSPTVKIASDALNFEKAIEEFFKLGYNKEEEERRIKIAIKNSWEKKIEKMWRIILGNF